MIKDPETPATLGVDYPMSQLTLRFVDKALERRFAIEHLVRALPTMRIFLLGASLFYAAFGFLDAFVISQAKVLAWVVRYAVVCPVLVATAVLTYSPLFVAVSQPVLAVAMFTAGMGVVAMTAFAPPPGNGLYYAGLIIVMIYGSSLINLRFRYAAILCAMLFSVYQAVATCINPIPMDVLVNNDFFLVASAAVSVFFSYLQELQSRRDFISTETIRRAKSTSDELRLQAEAASKAKSDFLAVMSHELRTPLNAIMGFSEVMKHRMFGPIGSDKYAGYVADIHNTAEHLLSIITDILDLSKADVGKLTLYAEDVDIMAVIDQSLRLMREKAMEHGLRLVSQPALGRPVLRVDARLVRQVILNLLANAIKFTPASGLVTVSLEAEVNGCWTILVNDTGIGIAAADLPRIVEPFVQVESALSRKHGGTGLGLPLVKKIMELHGGGITITSTLGAGTTVVARFPPGLYVRSANATAVVA
jgi:two-component system, cell cycle sensor histidine kinase PleC